MENLNSSEAVYGFAAWLTTRKEVVLMGSSQDSARIAELVSQFCDANNLPKVREDYHEALIHPSEEIDYPGYVKPIERTVFPSTDITIHVKEDKDYGGAHNYLFRNSIGFKDGKAEYVGSVQSIQFVQKNEDGSMIPGVQSEQLIIALLDRTAKLNARFPSEFNERMMVGLETFLKACQDRVQDRIDRGVMGELKK